MASCLPICEVTIVPRNATDLGSSPGRRKPGFVVPSAPPNGRSWVYSFGRPVLVVAAVLSLAISVATRYSTIVRREAGGTKLVASQSLDAKRQQLLRDGVRWFAPAATFVLFEPPKMFFPALFAVALTGRLYSEEFLYSRPPPSN